jgi:hypothetical protein
MSLALLALTLTLLLTTICGGHSPERFVFQRQTYDADPRRQISVFINGQSSEALQLHAVLVFSWPRHSYHNALVLSRKSVVRFEGITRHSEFGPHREINVISQHHLLRLQYDVAALNTEERFFGGVLPLGKRLDYDALLLLDYRSSLFNEVNTALFEQGRLTLLMSREDGPRDKGEFLGVFTIQCERHHRHRHCEMPLGNFLVNGREGEATALVVDLDSPFNLLPPDLFTRWEFHGEKRIVLQSASDEDAHLLLNPRFHWRLNEHSHTIVVGVDLLHHFQKVEYSPHRGSITVWHSWVYQEHETHEILKNVIYYVISTILTCLAYWITSPNYDVLASLLSLERPPEGKFPFPYKLVLVELLSLLIAGVLWIVIVFTGGGMSDGLMQHTTWPVLMRRRLLIFALSLYHAVVSIVLFVKTRKLTRHAFRHYYYVVVYALFTSVGAANYEERKRLASAETEPAPVKLVLLRNLTCHTLANTNLLLILNYLSEEVTPYNVPIMVASLGLLFFYTKTLFTSLLYLASRGVPVRVTMRKEPLFTALLFLSTAIFLAYTLLSAHLHHTFFLLQLNGLFSERVVHQFVETALCLTAVGALLSVYAPLVREVQGRQHRPVEEESDKTEK